MTRLAPIFLLLMASSLAACGSDDGGAAAPSPTAAPTLPPAATATPIPTVTSEPTPVLTETSTGTPTRLPTDTPEPATATATATEDASPTASPTPTETPTSEPALLCCGNGLLEEGEECDDGNAHGGDGCAANCTVERVVTARMLQQVVIYSGNIPVPLGGESEQTLRLGSPTGEGGMRACDGAAEFFPGELPVTQRLDDLRFEPMVLPGIACVCVRPVAARRCAPPLLNARPPSCDIARDCSADAALCGDPADCRAAHGEGNVTSGIIGCEGLGDVDYNASRDEDAGTTTCRRFGEPGPQGSAFLYSSRRVGSILGSDCTEDPGLFENGPDGLPCTDDDPEEARGSEIETLALTTGEAGATLFTTMSIAAGLECGPFPCQTSEVGRPFSCEALAGEPDTPGDFRLCSAVSSDVFMSQRAVTTSCFEPAD